MTEARLFLLMWFFIVATFFWMLLGIASLLYAKRLRKEIDAEREPTPYQKLSRGLKADPEWAWSWHCNIAMPILDNSKGKLTADEANEISKRLMKHLFEVDIVEPPFRPPHPKFKCEHCQRLKSRPGRCLHCGKLPSLPGVHKGDL